MPSLYELKGFKIFFWTNEYNEPVHVHVCKGHQTSNATKFWLMKDGGVMLASNGSKLTRKDVHFLIERLTLLWEEICEEWQKVFPNEEVKFYV